MAKVLHKHPRARYALTSFLVAIILNLGFSFTSVLISGPHPECGVNPEVGPCDLTGSSLNLASWMIVPTFVLWLIFMAMGFMFIWKKTGSEHGLRDGIVLAMIILLALSFVLPLLILVR